MTSPCSSQSVLSAACKIAQDTLVATLPMSNPPFERFVEPSRHSLPRLSGHVVLTCGRPV